MYHISLSKACIIIYLLSMAYIIKVKHQHKASTHMNTEVFMWKPSDWGENHGSFTKLCQSSTLAGATTPYNLLY